jgi:hypothetical protein
MRSPKMFQCRWDSGSRRLAGLYCLHHQGQEFQVLGLLDLIYEDNIVLRGADNFSPNDFASRGRKPSSVTLT